MTRHLILARHGAIVGDEGPRYLGHKDLPIGDIGIRQSLDLGRFLADWTIAKAFSSDLTRCRQTAEIALSGRNVLVVPRDDLRETSMGEWEGLLKSEVSRAFPRECAERERDLVHYRVRGGESFADCSERVVRALSGIIAASDGDILVVGHGSTNRLVLCHLLGMPIANMFRLGQDHGCVNVVQMDPSGCRVVLLNGKP